MTVEPGTVVPAVPTPLGWCSWCLGDRDVERQAVTSFAGTALCRECNRSANQEQDEQQEEMAAMTAMAGEQLRGLLQPPPASGGPPVGF